MMEILDEARHFADVSQPQRSEDLEMCLKRVVFKMELLGRVYKVRLYISLSAAFGTASCAWNSHHLCCPYVLRRSPYSPRSARRLRWGRS